MLKCWKKKAIMLEKKNRLSRWTHAAPDIHTHTHTLHPTCLFVHSLRNDPDSCSYVFASVCVCACACLSVCVCVLSCLTGVRVCVLSCLTGVRVCVWQVCVWQVCACVCVCVRQVCACVCATGVCVWQVCAWDRRACLTGVRVCACALRCSTPHSASWQIWCWRLLKAKSCPFPSPSWRCGFMCVCVCLFVCVCDRFDAGDCWSPNAAHFQAPHEGVGVCVCVCMCVLFYRYTNNK